MQRGSAAPQVRLHIAEHSSGRGIGTLHDSNRQTHFRETAKNRDIHGFPRSRESMSEPRRNLSGAMGAAKQAVVDLEEPATWPDAVTDSTQRWVEQLRGSTEFTSDLKVPLEAEEGFRSAFAGRQILIFHATRLFDYEVEVIHSQGLRQLTIELVEERIAAAHARGLLTDEERDQCLSQNVYAIKNTEGRENQVCGVIGSGIFDHPEHGWGLHPFLGGWGGEAMHGGPGPDSDPLLQRLGRPAVVSIALDIAAADAMVFPSLPHIFVGKAMGLEDAFGAIYVREDIPGSSILGIWQPGHAQYDMHRDLPRG